MRYSQKSHELYRKWFSDNGDGEVNFITSPESLFGADVFSSSVELIKSEIGPNGISKFIRSLHDKRFDYKYLFILFLVHCIEDTEQDERGYWNKVEGLLAAKVSADKRPVLLDQLLNFCKGHNIPFFDIYQNKNQENICGRIYSLLPMTKLELQRISYLLNTNLHGHEASDFYRLGQSIISDYQVLFNRATVNSLYNLQEPIEARKLDYLPEGIYSFGGYFDVWYSKYRQAIMSIPYSDEEASRMRDLIETRGGGTITYRDFRFYFQSGSDGSVMKFAVTTGAKFGGRLSPTNCPPSSLGRQNKPFLCIDNGDGAKPITIPNGSYLAVRDSMNPNWTEIRFDELSKVYKDSVVGTVSIAAERFQLPATGINNESKQHVKVLLSSLDQVDALIRGRYKNIDDGTTIEMRGGLRGRNGSYFWFALPYMTVQNNSQDNIDILLNGIKIINNGVGLREKVLRYIQNRIKKGEPNPLNSAKGQINQLVFQTRGDDRVINKLSIEGPKIEIEKSLLHGGVQAGEWVAASRDLGLCAPYSPDIDDSIEQDEHLLHWLSWHGSQGVSYTEFRNAVSSLYLEEEDEKGETKNVSRFVRRVIQQFVGIGFMSLTNVGGHLRFVADGPHFICNHYGDLLFRGARSWEMTRSILTSNSQPHISPEHPIDDKRPLPRLIYLKTSQLHSRLNIDGSDILKGFEKIGYKPGASHTREFLSAPMTMLKAFKLNLPKYLHPHESKLYGLVGKYNRLDVPKLKYVAIGGVEDINVGDVVKPSIDTYRSSFLITRFETVDGEKVPYGMSVIKELEEAMPYLSINHKTQHLQTTSQYWELGWAYDQVAEMLYVPVISGVPNELRIALQCTAGSYTSTRFVRRDPDTPSRPLITDLGDCWSNEPRQGTMEMEAFAFIPVGYIPVLEEKLLIKIIKFN